MPLTVAQGLLLDKTSKQIIREVKDRLIERGHKVTGQLENSFEIVKTENGIQIFVNDYLYDLEFGKSPERAKQENFTSLAQALSEWAANKGISVKGSYDSAGQAMARKQQKLGTVIWRRNKGKSSGLFDGIIDGSLAYDLAEQVGQERLTYIASQIVERFSSITNMNNV